MKRSILIKNSNNETIKELELSVVTSVKTSKQMIHFDKLKNGTWRMIYGEKTIPDIKQIEKFEIYRED